MHFKHAEAKAGEVLKESKISSFPVPINEIIRERGLAIEPYDLGDTISGVLVINEGKGVIGYNPSESKVRQRFTVAHELGHFEMHRKSKELFIDKELTVLFRGQDPSIGTPKQEREANAFAAAILMPEDYLIKELKKFKYDLASKASIKELARMFNVSVSAMSFRITNILWKHL